MGAISDGGALDEILIFNSLSSSDMTTWWGHTHRNIGRPPVGDHVIWWNTADRVGGLIPGNDGVIAIRAIDSSSAAIVFSRADGGLATRRVSMDGGRSQPLELPRTLAHCLFGDSVEDFWCLQGLAWRGPLVHVSSDGGIRPIVDGGVALLRVIKPGDSLAIFSQQTSEPDAGFKVFLMNQRWSQTQQVLSMSSYSAVAVGERPDGGLVVGYWEDAPYQPGVLPPLVSGDFCPP